MKQEFKKFREFQKWFSRFVKRNYGKKCPEFVWSCPICHVYFVKELFDGFIDDLIETENWSKSKKQKKR